MKEYSKKPEKTSRTLVDRDPQSSRQAPISEILQAYKTGNWTRQPIQQKTEEEVLTSDQPSGYTTMLKVMERNDRILQQYAPEKKDEPAQEKADPIQLQESPNNTGLPDELKTGIENLSGYNMDDVQVHYNSDKPAQLNALAYAQGTDIHVAPGQEKHLPHEAWHVVQQKQGRVQPTVQMQGMSVNDEVELEKEADAMGVKANQYPIIQKISDQKNNCNVLQMVHPSFLHGSYGAANNPALGLNSTIWTIFRHWGLPVTDAYILRESLVSDSNVPDSNIPTLANPDTIPNQAHHIVMVNGGGAAAVASRQLLANTGIDINSSVNGVLLPSVNHDDAGNATIHLGNHTLEYAQCVNNSLSHAINQEIVAQRPPNGQLWPAGATNAYARSHPGPLVSQRNMWLRQVVINRLDAIRNGRVK